MVTLYFLDNGYISPEYIQYRRFSSQSDVFSFGVLVLEVIAGQKNALGIRWQEKETRQMIDPCLTNEPDSIERITRCIHIASLCIQEDRESRPHTSSVVDWLNNSFDTPLFAVPNPIRDPIPTNYDNPTTSNNMSVSLLVYKL
ncbi:putative protein kinase RLK-Pelle-DLSV family [Helianthus annuus]|nr:putative protein kinase RLK-Pelle-DLSV family [Helianthus annuus]